MEKALDDIANTIPSEQIPESDQAKFAKARAMAEDMRKKKGSNHTNSFF